MSQVNKIQEKGTSKPEIMTIVEVNQEYDPTKTENNNSWLKKGEVSDEETFKLDINSKQGVREAL